MPQWLIQHDRLEQLSLVRRYLGMRKILWPQIAQFPCCTRTSLNHHFGHQHDRRRYRKCQRGNRFEVASEVVPHRLLGRQFGNLDALKNPVNTVRCPAESFLDGRPVRNHSAVLDEGAAALLFAIHHPAAADHPAAIVSSV